MLIHRIRKLNLFKPFFWTIISLVLILPLKIIKAAAMPPPPTCPIGQICNPLNAPDFKTLMIDIANIAIAIGFPIAVMFLIWAGYLFVSSRGNEEKLKTAKTTFMWAILGTAVLLGAKVIAIAIEATIASL